jgi:N-acetyl sugar amidotransferase
MGLIVQETEGKRFVQDPVDGPLEVKYGLPGEVRFCARCVISNQRPSSVPEFKNRPTDKKPTIVFDADGVCGACRYADMKEREIDWAARERELLALLDRHRSRDGSYDCIVPGSGGKDSAFAAHALKYKYGMNPLTVTWAPHVYTDVGWKNFQSWIHVGGFDNSLLTPNGRVHRTLTRLAFETLAHPFQPFIVGQKLAGARASVLHGVPLVFYGENPAEYGHDPRENFKPTMDPSFYARPYDPATFALSGLGVRELERHGIARRDLEPYLPLDPAAVARVGTDVHHLGYYVRWDPQEMYYYAQEHTGFQPNTERTEGTYSKYNSIDDKIDPLHYYTTFIKFGIGRATYDAAQEVRNRKITREEAVALVRRFDAEVPRRYLPEVLEYMGISEERFWQVIDGARSPHLWKKVGGDWVLRHQVS